MSVLGYGVRVWYGLGRRVLGSGSDLAGVLDIGHKLKRGSLGKPSCVGYVYASR